MEETKNLLRKLKPILGMRAKALWYVGILAETKSERFEHDQLLRILADRKAKLDFQRVIRLPPPAAETLCGEIDIGTVLYPETPYAHLGLRNHELIRHMLVVGSTGAGKTNLVLHLIEQLAVQQKPFLIFDWKQSYRRLATQPGGERLQVMRLGDQNCTFRFNPLIPPPGVHPKHWLALLIDVLRHSYFVAEGVEYLCRKAIDHLYEQFGIYEGKAVYPTFEDVEKVLLKEFVRGREMLWMSSAKRMLASLTFSGLLGNVLNVREHEPVERILSQQVIFELDNLATLERIFFIESLLLYLYHAKKNTTRKRDNHDATIILEEAHHILSGRKEALLGQETIVETVIRMIREFGVGVIVIDQEPSKLSQSILANTNTKICFTLGSGKDISRMARAMRLTSDERDCIDQLSVGHALIKVKHRFHEPVHVHVPLAKFAGESPRTTEAA